MKSFNPSTIKQTVTKKRELFIRPSGQDMEETQKGPEVTSLNNKNKSKRNLVVRKYTLKDNCRKLTSIKVHIYRDRNRQGVVRREIIQLFRRYLVRSTLGTVKFVTNMYLTKL